MKEDEKNENLIATFIISKLIFSILCFIMFRLYKAKKRDMSSNSTVNPNFAYNTDCPICFNILMMPIVSDCGHGYCADCLQTFFEKNSWNNLCPLCRQQLKNLKILENENYKYSETRKQKLLSTIAKISKTPKRNFANLVTSQTAYYASCGTLLLLLWTWAVVNIDNLLYYCMWMYTTYYKSPAYDIINV
ncbi:unnamed protein product [Phaedon cochleariae]|uniref:RING-type domain-containing protein n=1 Tax=Phaedon cochleariae TaxID=80249 RepID=A0A9P0GT82_PHACE|nr:unnamed protein product [Phaedon cochleariae]